MEPLCNWPHFLTTKNVNYPINIKANIFILFLKSQLTSVKHSENRPPSTAINRGDPLYFTEWSELLDGDGINPIVPHLNSSMDDYLNSLDQSSELGTRDSSRSSMMFGSFFDEVERFSKNVEDDLMMDNNVVAMDAPIYVNY